MVCMVTPECRVGIGVTGEKLLTLRNQGISVGFYTKWKMDKSVLLERPSLEGTGLLKVMTNYYAVTCRPKGMARKHNASSLLSLNIEAVGDPV